MCSFNSIWEDQQSAMRRGEHSSFGMHLGQALPEVVYRGPLPKGLGAVRYFASVTLKPTDDCLFAKSMPAANGSEARLAQKMVVSSQNASYGSLQSDFQFTLPALRNCESSSSMR